MSGNLPPEQRNKRMIFRIEFRHIIVFFVAFICVNIRKITLCFSKSLTDQSSRSHSCNRSFISVIVNSLWIFSQSKFYPHRLYDHIVNTSAIGFDSDYLTAAGISAPRSDNSGGNSPFIRLFKASVHRINAVNSSKLRGKGICSFITVVSFKVDAVFNNSKMSMSVNKSGNQKLSLTVQILCTDNIRTSLFNSNDFTVFNFNPAVFYGPSLFHCFYLHIIYFHKCSLISSV